MRTTKFKQIINEISHDLGVEKQLVRDVLILLFKEIAITLILKGKPVLIRRFVKLVIALRGLRKIKDDINNVKTNKDESK